MARKAKPADLVGFSEVARGSQSQDRRQAASRAVGTFATNPIHPPGTFDSSARIGTEPQPTPGGSVIHLAAPDDNRPVEPDWTRAYPRIADRKAAAEHWRSITDEMAAAGTLSRGCGAAIKRLTFARIVFANASREIAKVGPVVKAKRTGTMAFSPLWTVVQGADSMASHLEAQLGLTPRSRDKVSPVKRRKAAGAAALHYLSRKPESAS